MWQISMVIILKYDINIVVVGASYGRISIKLWYHIWIKFIFSGEIIT